MEQRRDLAGVLVDSRHNNVGWLLVVGLDNKLTHVDSRHSMPCSARRRFILQFIISSLMDLTFDHLPRLDAGG